MEEKNFLDSVRGKELNFLIGSGASNGAVPTLWIDSLNKSFEDLLKSDEISEDYQSILYYIWFQLWISKTQILEKDEKYVNIHHHYDNFITNVITLLNEEGFDKPKRANIFTTNYDTFFELSFDNISSKNRLTYFNDGSHGFMKKHISTENYYKIASHSGINYNFERSIPSVNLVKLHGSVTWEKEDFSNRIEVNLDNKIFREIMEYVDEIDRKLMESSYDINESVRDRLLTSNLENYIFEELNSIDDLKELFSELTDDLNDDINEFRKLYEKLPVVNPTDRKFSETVFEQHYYQMLRMLSFELERENSVLIVFGFSFADQHILDIVRRSMINPSLQIYIIAYSDDAKKNIMSKLGSDIRVFYFPSESLKEDNDDIKGDFDYFNSLLNGVEEYE